MSADKEYQGAKIDNLSEVLKEFVENDEGFGQYTDRYEEVSSDIAVRRQFAAWTAEMDKLDIVRALGKSEGKAEGLAEGKAEGLAEGKAEGKAEEKIESAKRMLLKGLSPEIVAECLDLPLSQIQELVHQTSIE